MKKAIVTGGNKGIGLAVVEDLLRNGYFVYLTFASDTDAVKTAEKKLSLISPNYRIMHVDQSNDSDLYQFTKEISSIEKTIDCIICNAGTTIRKKAKDITNDEWEKVMQVCVNSHFYLIRELWNNLSNNARIIFTGSMMGIFPHASSLAYGVAKSAVHALAKNLIKEFEGTNITVNVIAPGFVDTDWQKNKPQEIKNTIYQKTALHRFATPEEVSKSILFCINNEFINGAVIEVSGGYCYK